MVKNLPAMQEIQAQSLGWEDPLEKEMATHSSVLAWRIPWTEEPVRPQSWGHRVRHDWATNTYLVLGTVFFPHSYYNKPWYAPNSFFPVILRQKVLEKTLESPLDCREIKQVNPKGNQPWIFIARTDAEAPILGPPDVNRLIGKDPDAGKDWR